MKIARNQLNKKSSVLFLSLTDKSYSRSSLLVENTFVNSSFVRLEKNISKYSQIKKILIQESNIDAVIVMSPSHVLVPYLRFLFKGFIILDAGWPLSDSIENRIIPLYTRVNKKVKAHIVDFLAFNFSDIVYLESKHQATYSSKKFLISKKKIKVRFTGSLEKIQTSMHQDFWESIHAKCKDCNPVVFRGKYNEEAGLELLSKVAEVLNPSIHLIVLCPTLPEKIEFPQRQNITVIKKFLPRHELESVMSQAKLMIGQLGNSDRLNRTVPHKFFEAARLGIPYLTPATTAIQEIGGEEAIYFISNKNENLLALQIFSIVCDKEALEKKAKKIQKLYETNLSNAILAKNFLNDLTM